MTAPTTLPDALAEIAELRGQVRDLLRLLGQDAKPSDLGVSASAARTTGAYEFSEGLVPKQAGKDAAQHLLNLHQMIETVPDIIFTLDLQGNLVGWNKRLQIVTGFTPQELNGRPALSFVPEHEHAPTAAAIQRAFEDGYAELEGHLLTKDGSTIPYHWTGARLHDPQGRMIGLTGVGRDITDWKMMERQRQEQTERLRLAMEIADLATWDWDISTNKVIWSENYEQVKRLAPGTFDGTFKAYQRLVHPDDLPTLFADINRALAGPDPYHTEHRIVPPGGEIQWIEGNGAVYRDEMGRPIRMIGTARNITERKRMEDERRNRETLISLMLQTGPGCIKRVAADGTLLQMNQAGLRMIEMEEERAIGCCVFDVIAPEHRASFIEMHQAVLTGATRTLQVEIQGARGARRWIETYAVPFLNPVTGCTEQLAVTHDITARKQTEEALRLSEERYARATAVGRVGVWELDVATGLYYGDANLKNLFGYRPDELSTDPYVWLGLVHPDDQSIALTAWEGVVSGSTDDYHYELRMIRKDGTIIWTEVRGHSERDERGHVQRLIGATVDITERKQADMALRISQMKLQQTLEASNTGLWEWNTTTNEVTFSPEWKRQLGYEETELPDTFESWESRLHPDDRARTVAYAVQYRDHPVGTFRQDFRLRHKDGTYRWIESQASFVTEADGRRERLLGSHIDITELKRVENTLAQRSHQQQVIAAFGEFALRERELQRVLDQAVQRIAQTLDAEYCKVLELQQGGTSLLLKAGVGWHDGLVGRATVSAGLESHAGYTLSLNEPVIVENLETDRRFSGPPLLFDHGVISGLSVIIRGEREPWGVLGVHTSARRSFTQDDVNFVQSMANILGSLIDRHAVEETLAHRERELRTMLDALPIGIWFTDPQGRVLYGNPVGQQIWSGAVKVGLPDQSHGIRHWENIEATDLPHRWTIGSVLTKDQPVLDEMIEIEAADGSRRTIRNSAVQVRNHTGTLQGAIVLNEDITERKRTEDALRISEERLRLALEAGDLGSWDVDMRTGLAQWNRRHALLQGYEPVDGPVPIQKWMDRVHPEDRQGVMAALERAKQERSIFAEEHRLVRADNGEERWLSLYGRFSYDVSGEPLRFNGVSLDITKRKLAEAVLAASETRFRTVVEGTSDWMWEIDAQGRYTYSSPRVRDFLGYEPEEILGKTPFDFMLPEEAQRVGTLFGPIIEARSPFDRLENTQRHKDGRLIVLECRGVPILDADGTLRGYRGFDRDVTTQKLAEAALLESEERFRTLVWNIPGAVYRCAVDREWTMSYLSHAIEEIVGYPAAEFIGNHTRSYASVIHPDDRRLVEDATRASLRERRPYVLEYRLIHANGEVRWVYEKGQGVFTPDGEVGFLDGAIFDITDRVEAEQALRQQHGLLTAIMDASIDHISVKDLNGRYIHMNRTGANALGMPIDEIIGWDDIALWGSESAATLRTGDRRVVESGETITTEESLTAEGKVTVFLTTKAPYRDLEGRTIGVISVARDITERKQAEETLRQSETRFRSLFENSPIAYQSLDQEGRFIDVNQRLCQLLGYDREELIGREFGDLWADERQSDFPQTFASFMQAGNVRNELALRHRDGTIVNAVIDGRIQRDKDGKFVRTHCILTDITERKKVEDALRRSEARLNEAQHLAHIGSWELDLMRNRLIWSDEIFRIFEIDQHQFGASYEAFLSLVHPDDRSAVDRAYTKSVRDRTPYEITHRLLMLDGRVKYVHEQCETLYDAQGEPQLSFGTVQDVTERMRLAEREAARLKQLQTLSELGLTLSGDPGEIFERVVRMIGDLFKVRVVCLSELVGPELYFIAVYVNGEVVRNAGHCPLAVAPCATVERDKELRLFDRVMELFPDATFLRDHQALAYCGFPALDAQGQVVAVTCLLDDKPREFTAEEQALLRVFGQRIAVEIERSRLMARQKQNSEELRRSHAFIRQIVDTDPNFVFAKDRAGRFTLVNKAIATAYGTTVDNLIGKTDADFNRNPDEVHFSRLHDLEVIDARRERFIPEERITDAAGNVRWLQTVKRPLLNESGEAVMVLGAATDITERKRMEEALRQRERDLQQAIEDRQRISEDLHDGILQSIYAIGLGLEACKPLIACQPSKSATKLNATLQRTIGQLNHVLEEVRNFIAGLESQILDGQDFEAVLRTMVQTLAAPYPIPYKITIEQAAAQNLSTEQAYHVMNIAREALSNSLRHSGATRITVSLKRLRRSVRLSVTDNGVGFNPVGARDVGHGLANMAARTQKIGGKLTLQSKPRQGAKVLVDIPRRLTDADT